VSADTPIDVTLGDASPDRRGSLLEVAATFLRLGATSFGGPVAHLGFFHRELVTKRGWLDDAHYSDLVALCQFLPGPASSQVAFALGMQRAGFWGASIASFCFTAPSALLMVAFAYGVARVDVSRAGWLHGIKLAAAAVVMQAVWAMGKKLCPDRNRISIAVASAATLLLLPGALAQLTVIAVGAGLGWWLYREAEDQVATPEHLTKTPRIAAGVLVAYLMLLVGLPVLASKVDSFMVATFDAFYRSGALVFGGGHVVLPLLRAEVVPRGWLTDDQFLAGYGAAQAMPGPLFSFAAYLGAAMGAAMGTASRWVNATWCVFALFLPGWLLIAGALPFWHRLRVMPGAKSMLSGANAAVVGVLLSALYSPVFTEGVHSASDAAVVAVAYLLLEHWKLAPWLLVASAAAVGQWLL
jgi:chromate transporter